MSGFISNPYKTSTPTGMFSHYTDGVRQGNSFADAASQNYLASGLYSNTSGLALWGGLPIVNTVGNRLFSGVSGGVVERASTVASITGFSVFDQAHHYTIDPSNNVPLCASGEVAHYFRMGSNARIPVRASAELVAIAQSQTANGGPITTQVSWDFARGQLIPYNAGVSDLAIASIAITGTASPYTVTVTTSSAHGLASGDIVTIAGVTPTAYNGVYSVTVTSTTAFTYTLTTNPGTATVTSGTVSASGGALNVRVLDVLTSNCDIIDFDPTSGDIAWKLDAAAVILI